MTKICIVTGATAGIGKQIAKNLAHLKNYRVIFAVRNLNKAESVLKDLQSEGCEGYVEAEHLDFGDLRSISTFSQKIGEKFGKVDVLVNNAAIAGNEQKTVTTNGIEEVFQTNVLGPFLLTKMLLPWFASSSRVVNLASNFAGDLKIDDVEYSSRVYSNESAYKQSKQCNRLLTYKFARDLGSKEILVNACHPGVIETNLLSSLGFGGGSPVTKGAETPTYLAISEDISTGKYYDNQKEKKDPWQKKEALQDELYNLCDEMTSKFVSN